MFWGDGSDAPPQYNKPRAATSPTSPGHHGHPGRRGDDRGWKKANPGKQVGSFGPPTYGAVAGRSSTRSRTRALRVTDAIDPPAWSHRSRR